MAEMTEESSGLESTTVGVYRTAATVKGGRRFSFGSLVVVGDRNGRVGIGYAKANQVPPAIEKAQKEAKRRLRHYPLIGRTIPHAVTGRYGSCLVRLLPASPGTGVIAGAAVRAPLEMAGVQDCLTKSFGSTNSKNLVKAVLNGLEQLRSREEVEALRGVAIGTTTVEESIQRSRAGMPATPPDTGPREGDRRGRDGRGKRRPERQGGGEGRSRPRRDERPAPGTRERRVEPAEPRQEGEVQSPPAETAR